MTHPTITSKNYNYWATHAHRSYTGKYQSTAPFRISRMTRRGGISNMGFVVPFLLQKLEVSTSAK